MTNRLSPPNLAARSTALARSLAELVSPTRLLPFRQSEDRTMSAARFAPLTLLAVLAVAAALFAIYVYPAYAQEGPAPDKPRGLSATSAHGQVVLTWNDPGDNSITGYVILRRVRINDQGGDFSVLVADTGTAALTYTDGTVAASTTYTYRIKAINEHGTSERSRWFHIDTPAAPPPEPVNSPATGAPTISGTVQAGETLAADTNGIADEDGLENAAFTYQWLGDDSAIQGATARAYTLTDSDEGKAIRVRVSFTDNAGNEESLTSAATAAVAAAEPAEPPDRPTDLSATATHNQVVLTWDNPGDDSITGYVILRRNRDTDAKGHFNELVSDTGSAATTYTDTDRGGGDPLYLPDQGHQRARDQRAFPLVSHRHAGSAGACFQQPRHRLTRHCRHSPGGGNADGEHVGHRRRGRSGKRRVHLPVAGGRHGHTGSNGQRLHAGGSR